MARLHCNSRTSAPRAWTMQSGQHWRGFGGAIMTRRMTACARGSSPPACTQRRRPPQALQRTCPSSHFPGVRKENGSNITRPRKWRFIHSISHRRVGASRVARSVTMNSYSGDENAASCDDNDNGKSSAAGGGLDRGEADGQRGPSVSIGPEVPQVGNCECRVSPQLVQVSRHRLRDPDQLLLQ